MARYGFVELHGARFDGFPGPKKPQREGASTCSWTILAPGASSVVVGFRETALLPCRRFGPKKAAMSIKSMTGLRLDTIDNTMPLRGGWWLRHCFHLALVCVSFSVSIILPLVPASWCSSRGSTPSSTLQNRGAVLKHPVKRTRLRRQGLDSPRSVPGILHSFQQMSCGHGHRQGWRELLSFPASLRRGEQGRAQCHDGSRGMCHTRLERSYHVETINAVLPC